MFLKFVKVVLSWNALRSILLASTKCSARLKLSIACHELSDDGQTAESRSPEEPFCRRRQIIRTIARKKYI